MTSSIRYTIDLDDLPFNPRWPTQRRDVAAALAIIRRHQGASGNGLRLLDDWGETDAETLWIKLPAWLRELGRYYQQRYGDQAPEVMQCVLNVLLPEESCFDDTSPDMKGQAPRLH